MKLRKSYYQEKDVVKIARDLIGKILYTRINGKLCSGIISETEAYEGVTDKASHAYGGRRTARTETLYADGGKTYVYLCYGIHHLLNFVTNIENTPHAVLIRGIIPLEGTEIMMQRCNKKSVNGLTDGPGKVSRALGITIAMNNISLLDNTIWVEENKKLLKPFKIASSPRIGIDYAGEDAKLPYRFNLVSV